MSVWWCAVGVDDETEYDEFETWSDGFIHAAIAHEKDALEKQDRGGFRERGLRRMLQYEEAVEDDKGSGKTD